MAAVREMLGDGTFHEATVEAVAERAGVVRATAYQHLDAVVAATVRFWATEEAVLAPLWRRRGRSGRP